MVELLVSLLIGLIVLGVIWYIIQLLPLPEPFGRIAQS
jgi:preprotein translocase subunit Sss1